MSEDRPLPSPVSFVVTPHFERELPPSSTPEDIDAWRRRHLVAADPATVLGALLSRFEGLSVEHAGVRATVRWFATLEYAGEKALVVLLALATAEARAEVLAMERGWDRVFGVPVCPDPEARMETLLRDTLDQRLVDGALPEAYFFGAACEFLQGVAPRLVGEAPRESFGQWLVEEGIRELAGDLGEVALSAGQARGQRLSVHLRVRDATLQPAKGGVWVTPIVELRRVGARGNVLDATEQAVSLGFVGTDAMFEPLPDAAARKAGLAALRRWRAGLAKRIAKIPASEAKGLMPMDLPWGTSPVELAVRAVKRGAA